MKMEIIKSRVLLTPENAEEKAKLETLWKVLIDCVDSSRKLVPIGEYVPQKGDTTASFHIEGIEADETVYAAVKVAEDTGVYCKICNKLQALKAGDPIPLCCGQLMVVVD